MKKIRYIARFIIEAETPLFVGSGESSLLKDALVQKDVNGFPMILGTSLTGVLRHAFNNEDWCSRIFGDAESKKDGAGSLLKLSAACMMLNDTKVSEGILENIEPKVTARFNNLPSRQHVRITEKGVAETNGLFDNEVVYKGVRFVFEMELKGTLDDNKIWASLIEKVQSPTFRIGSGTRNGYGSLKVIGLFNKTYNLEIEEDFKAYVNFSPSFNVSLPFKEIGLEEKKSPTAGYTHYRLNLSPDSFFVFSEGFGDEDADNKPLEEEVVVYKNNTQEFEKQTVIPASSIKGAIAHRTAFHCNKKQEQYADEGNGAIGSNNRAVGTLFGKAGKDVTEPQAGNVFINDWYYSDEEIANNKIFNHVAIDRFTGGALNGALFSEKVSNLLGNGFCFDVYVKESKEALNDKIITESFEEALKDIAKGLLPLGGMTTKGHGVFTGVVLKNGIEMYNYNTKNEN
ncbi:hypothetical protein K8354_13185 [Polaribacter litorisediminis]|uniref:RAMP superfamily CRISPR-associated protein n=1 Tax=Polaribacter litorisediminis TaxID=1908341 RepID=UPI001CBB7DE5|nr:RAMP superfamily CRISPR-associated protein [Polaribacter litorisediminis]UAM97267.1 hypothetical protein K8354_13185 [Polaribacter litorisediminis]